MPVLQQAAGLYPIMLRLTGKRCVVIGGGPVALRKVQSLIDAGADDVVVISASIVDELAVLRLSGAIRIIMREYEPSDIEGAALVFTATNDPGLNGEIGLQCTRLGIWHNAADDGERSAFVTPAVIRRGELVLALTTGGASPALAAKLKKELAEAYGSEYASRLRALRMLRGHLLSDRRTANPESGSEARMLLRAAAEDEFGWLPLAKLLSDSSAGEAERQEEQIKKLLDSWIEQLRKQVT